MYSLIKIDRQSIPDGSDEIRAFCCVKDEAVRLPFLLEFHRSIGVDRFFFIDNMSDDGSANYLLNQPDVHLFRSEGKFFEENVSPPNWSNALRNAFGSGHWCLSLDADEMFVYPNFENFNIKGLCEYLDRNNTNCMKATVLDMYAKGPISQSIYNSGESFLERFPYFDPEFGEKLEIANAIPSELTFSKFRERAFWTKEHKRTRPPCITQVPLVKWNRKTRYNTAQHTINQGRLSQIEGTILHFKFLPGFRDAIKRSLDTNKDVNEKGLMERRAYINVLEQQPDYILHYKGSVEYKDSRQLAMLGWSKTSNEFDKYCDSQNRFQKQ